MKKVGLIGCGNISTTYLNNQECFKKQLEIVACADINMSAAEKCAETYNLKAMSVEELLAEESIDIVLNLTIPKCHAEINLKALNANKHVYCEKPFALSCESAMEVINLAKAKNLYVGCAPDTFLGGGHQTCRKLIDSGIIGEVVNGTAFLLNHGPESWHPSPGFFFLDGGGPLFDVGPYYITILVNVLGPVTSVMARSNRATSVRQGSKVNINREFPVETDTHFSAILEFECGAIITLITSFDVWKNFNIQDIEFHGTKGSIHEPDPNFFGGEIRLFQGNLNEDWATIDNQFIYNDDIRGIGLADMADAIETGRAHRASGELAYHVLEIMESIVKSTESKVAVTIKSRCKRPEPMKIGLIRGNL